MPLSRWNIAEVMSKGPGMLGHFCHELFSTWGFFVACRLYFCNKTERRQREQDAEQASESGTAEEYASFSVTHAYKVSARYTDVGRANRWVKWTAAGCGLRGDLDLR